MRTGAQLYTLRHFTQTEQDLAITLRRIREIGYTTVQLSALGNIPIERIRDLCEKNNLEVALTHTNPDRILYETDKVIAEHEALGCKYIGIGMMPERYRHVSWFAQFIKDFKEPAKRIAANGKLLMYHNHDFEFHAFQHGKRMIEEIMDRFTPEEMGFTLDTYWVQAAGADPCVWIKRLAGRLPCVHLKDMAVSFDNVQWKTVMAPVLEGNMNIEGILETLKAESSTEYLLVEQDQCYEDEFACLKKSYDNLSKLGYR